MKRFWIWGAVFVCLIGCATSPPPAQVPSQSKPYQVGGKWYQPVADATGFREKGMASWYGADHHGRKTASGETYNMNALTAAHKTLPFGTLVRVTHLQNKRSVDVVINDRGPFAKGRVIDLSYEAAKRIGLVADGTARVEIQVVGQPVTSSADGTGKYAFQVASFSDRENAQRLLASLNLTYDNVHMVRYDSGRGTLYRVYVGGAQTLKEAEHIAERLRKDGYPDALMVAQ